MYNCVACLNDCTQYWSDTSRKKILLGFVTGLAMSIVSLFSTSCVGVVWGICLYEILCVFGGGQSSTLAVLLSIVLYLIFWDKVNLELADFVRISGWQVPGSSCFYFLTAGITGVCCYIQTSLHECLESGLRFSCLCDKHFAGWVISSVSVQYFINISI